MVPLQDTLESIVAKSRQNVYVYGKLEQIAERTFRGIPYKIINGKAENYEITPQRFDVTIRGGITAVSEIEISDIELIIDANDIYWSNSSTAFVPAKSIRASR